MMKKAMDHSFKLLIWKLFRDDIITFCVHSDEKANHYFDYLNACDASGKDWLCKLKIKMAFNF